MPIRVPGKTKESRALERLARSSLKGMRQKFLRAIKATVDNTTRAEVERALSQGNVSAAVRAIPLDEQMATKLSGAFMKEYRDVFESAGAVSARLLPTKDFVEFTVQDDRALRWVRDYAAKRVTEITEDQRIGLRATMSTMLRDGLPAREAAKLIAGQIGLHSRQMRAVENRRAFLEGEGLNREQVSRRLLQYERQLLARRAETVARTEAQSAISAGEQQALLQAVDQGLLEATSTRVWIANPGTDDEDCLELDGQEVGLEEEFDTPWGQILFPPAHPNCVCSCIVRPGGKVNPFLNEAAA